MTAASNIVNSSSSEESKIFDCSIYRIPNSRKIKVSFVLDDDAIVKIKQGDLEFNLAICEDSKKETEEIESKDTERNHGEKKETVEEISRRKVGKDGKEIKDCKTVEEKAIEKAIESWIALESKRVEFDSGTRKYSMVGDMIFVCYGGPVEARFQLPKHFACISGLVLEHLESEGYLSQEKSRMMIPYKPEVFRHIVEWMNKHQAVENQDLPWNEEFLKGISDQLLDVAKAAKYMKIPVLLKCLAKKIDG